MPRKNIYRLNHLRLPAEMKNKLKNNFKLKYELIEIIQKNTTHISLISYISTR